MQIYINGNIVELANNAASVNIQMALEKSLPESQQQQSFALALNGDFIGKDDYAITELQNNDSIDILFPIVGG